MNKKIDELRDELNDMISKNIDPKEILKLSQELDIYIVEEIKNNSSVFSPKEKIEDENA